MLFDLAGLARLLRRGRRRPLGDVPAQCRRHAVRAEAGARVPLPGIHGARAAQDRRRRGHRGSSRHRDSRQGGADDGEQGRAGGDQRAAARAADGEPGRHARRAVRRRQGRLLSHRARRADRRTRDGVAAVHHRRADRSGADGLDRQAGTRYQRLADRRSLHRGARRRRLRRQGSRAGLLGQRLGREDGAALRRQQAPSRSQRRPYLLPGRAQRVAGRLRVLLRACRR